MRLATISRILAPLALSTALVAGVPAQEHVNISPGTVRDQLNQTGSSGTGSSAQPQPGPSQAEVKMPKKPAAPAKGPAPSAAQAPVKAPAGAPAKPAAKAPAKESAKSPAKAPDKVPAKAPDKVPSAPVKSAASAPAKAPQKPAEAAKAAAPATASAVPSGEKAPEEKPVVRRDPFDTLLTKARAGNAPPENLPPGKAGLVVATLRIDGIVHSPNGMIAIVSNAQQRVYFLRDGDKLYDGSVDKIALDSISFHEVGKDAFGKPLERTVTKQLYASSGEQQ